MRSSQGQRSKSRVNGTPAAILAAISALSIGTSAQAQSDYDVTINTSSLSGTGATLTFDLISGGGTQSNSVTISDFSTNGALISGGVNSGSVSGSLTGSATISNASFFNELQQKLTLGSTIAFQVDATTNAPSGGSLPDTLSVFLLDPSASFSLTNTPDPTSSDSLVTLQIDGSKGGTLAVYSGTDPTVPMSVTAATGGGGTSKAPEMDPSTSFSALALLLGGVAILRGRRIVAIERQDRRCMPRVHGSELQ